MPMYTDHGVVIAKDSSMADFYRETPAATKRAGDGGFSSVPSKPTSSAHAAERLCFRDAHDGRFMILSVDGGRPALGHGFLDLPYA